MTEEGKRRTNNSLDTVIAKLSFLEDTKIPEEAPKKEKLRIIQEEIKKNGIDLDPYKFDLKKEEEIMVQPIIVVGKDGRRTKFNPSIFEDTWATIKIPGKARKHWKKEHEDIIKARKQTEEGTDGSN